MIEIKPSFFANRNLILLIILFAIAPLAVVGIFFSLPFLHSSPLLMGITPFILGFFLIVIVYIIDFIYLWKKRNECVASFGNEKLVIVKQKMFKKNTITINLPSIVKIEQEEFSGTLPEGGENSVSYHYFQLNFISSLDKTITIQFPVWNGADIKTLITEILKQYPTITVETFPKRPSPFVVSLPTTI